jgi:hypothetical protein
MANTANDNIVNDNLPTARPAPFTYDTSYVTYRWDNIAAVRLGVSSGGYSTPGPGVGIGQIFPTRQDR